MPATTVAQPMTGVKELRTMDDDDQAPARMDTMGDPSDSRTAGENEAPGTIVDFTFKRSAVFADFAGALAKAQREMEGASKGSLNPHFKNRYADLSSVWDACREPLGKHGIAVLQLPCAQGPTVTLTTLLAHESGQWIQSDLTMAAQQNTPQGIGSCITYARRYALASMVGVAPEDDDGNAASQPGTNGNGHAQQQPPPPSRPQPMTSRMPEGFDNWMADLEAVADEGTPALESAWKKSQPYMRKYLMDTNNAKWEALKARAAAKVAVSA